MAANPASYPIERYKHDTHEAVGYFIHEEITFPERIARLEDAHAKLLREVSVEDLSSLRDLIPDQDSFAEGMTDALGYSLEGINAW